MARELMRAHYEPGNQSRSIKYVWRRYALPEMGVLQYVPTARKKRE